MKQILAAGILCCLLSTAPAGQTPEFRDLFNGKDLSGWINVNTAPDTWASRTDCWSARGRPLGVICSEKQYENFVLHIEWRHMEAGGNSGVFVWSNSNPNQRAGCPMAWRSRCWSSSGPT